MKIVEANSFYKKFKGLMFASDFDYILKIKCNGIHTFFMKLPIDVFLTDKNNTVLYIYRNISPNKIILPKKGVKYTYEVKSGVINNILIGDAFNYSKKS